MEDAKYNAEASGSQEEAFAKKEANTADLNGSWECQARRMANSPCTHLCGSLHSLLLSVVAFVAGKFSISSKNVGWESRGTLISDRQTQLLLTQINQEYLFTGDDDAWEDLLNNIQPGWEEDDAAEADSHRLKRASDSPVHPAGSRGGLSQHALPFGMTRDMYHRLQEQADLLPGCDIGWDSCSNLTNHSRLCWPVC